MSESDDEVVITSIEDVAGDLTLKEMEHRLLKAQEVKIEQFTIPSAPLSIASPIDPITFPALVPPPVATVVPPVYL